jgi:ribosomal subunit interface protein
MNFLITGDNVVVTQSLHEYAQKNFKHVLEKCDAVPTVVVVLKVQPHAKKNERKTVTVNIRALEKESIFKSATGSNMYALIKELSSLVKNEIDKRKGKKHSPRFKSVDLSQTAHANI